MLHLAVGQDHLEPALSETDFLEAVREVALDLRRSKDGASAVGGSGRQWAAVEASGGSGGSGRGSPVSDPVSELALSHPAWVGFRT